MKILKSSQKIKNIANNFYFRRLKKILLKISALKKYYAIQKHLDNKRLFFFFPFWNTGGGERVHADILKVFSYLNPVCFITGRSANKGLKDDFETNSQAIEIWQWTDDEISLNVLLKRIATSINKVSNPIIFGCNSHFFYKLIPYLEPHVKVIDLLHAFSGPKGFEYISLPYISRIDHRIILGNKTRNDFKQLYRENNIPENYLTRFVIIPNKVDSPSSLPLKDATGNLIILFVARNSPEKRVDLFLRITEICAEQNLPVEFLMIGDFNDLCYPVNDNTSIIGEVYNKDDLNKFYSRAHLLFVTSSREGFPMVILEGMSHGVIPVSTAVGEIPAYINKSAGNGFLIDSTGDNEAIAKKFIMQLNDLVKNRNGLGEYSSNAYFFVKKHFSTENFESSYKSVLLNNGFMP